MAREPDARVEAVVSFQGVHTVTRSAALAGRMPVVSLAMPCYNEADCIEQNATALVTAFAGVGSGFELVLVDNGSTDDTGTIIDRLIDSGLPVCKVAVEVNRGYSYGIRQGLEACRGAIIGYSCADGQVSARDTLNIYLAMNRPHEYLAKARRRLRKDSWKRKSVSIVYNGLMYVLFGWLGSIDLNASPKFFSRANYHRMKLRSDDWFLDPEIMLKARELGLQVVELNVEGQPRQGGHSNVRRQTIFEFLSNIWSYRWGGEQTRWRATLSQLPVTDDQPAHPSGPHSLDDVRVVRQNRFADDRGFLHKVLLASQHEYGSLAGEVYVTAALPGQSKGHHFHRLMGEWFAVVQGRAQLYTVDPRTGEKRVRELSAQDPCTVYVPAGLAHALHNPGPGEMICVAWAEREHDPEDVAPYAIAIEG